LIFPAVLNKVDKKNIGYVAIGLSDIIIRREVPMSTGSSASFPLFWALIVGAVILSGVTIKHQKLSRARHHRKGDWTTDREKVR
jgi:hypothetical protein